MAVPVVLDVDTGVDDACALLLAALHPDLDLRAVTCVAGNTGVDQVVTNTLTVLEAAGRAGIPVARGARRPLLERPREARHVHGDDGMGDLGLPPPSGRPDPRHAVEILRDTLLTAAGDGERITLVPLAPLTNLALLLRTYPEAAGGLARIVFMGGAACVGNVTATAEFNIWSDPEAAAIVIDAAGMLDVPVAMYGLEVFGDVRVSREQARDLAALGTPAGRLAAGLVRFQCERFGTPDATIGDAGAVCMVADPEGVRTRRLPLRVELSGSWTRGQTVVDQRRGSPSLGHDPQASAPAAVDVALAVDGARYAHLWRTTISAAAAPR